MTSKSTHMLGIYLHKSDEERLLKLRRDLMTNGVIEANKSLIMAAGLLALEAMGVPGAHNFIKILLAERAHQTGQKVNLTLSNVSKLLHDKFKKNGLVNMEPTSKNFDILKKLTQEVVAELAEDANRKARI